MILYLSMPLQIISYSVLPDVFNPYYIVVFNLFCWAIKSLLLWMKCVLKPQMLGFKLDNYGQFSLTWSCGSR